MNWTFGRTLALGFSIAVATLVVVGSLGYRSAQSLIDNERSVAHTNEVRSRLADLMSSLKDAETGQRGFVITGLEAFLEPYRSSLADTERAKSDVARLTVDNSDQQRTFGVLVPLLDARLIHLQRLIEVRRTLGLEAAAKEIAEGEGKVLMDRIRQTIAQMEEREAALLKLRSGAATESSEFTKGIILWGSLLGIGLVIVVGNLLSRSLTSQIGAAVAHIQTSSAELQAVANQQATGAKEQVTAMSEISTTISELLATSRQIAESAQRVTGIAEETATAARSGDVIVERGHESIIAIRRQVDVIVHHMLDLGKKSQQIGGVLGIVSELAEQTNILSINATIEAVGAGEAGRRFGVVADEIRKLADRVGAAAKEIGVLINDIRSAVNTTVMTTETGSKSVENGAEQFGKVAAAFTQIGQQVSVTTDAAREIELSTKQQTTAVEQVNVAMTDVAQASKEAELSTGQTLRTADELSHLSRELLRLVQQQTRAAQTRSRS